MSKNVKNTGDRENFSSRLGFILISAGCAIGLGNVWKFPYVVGENGGAAFLVLYIICMFILGLPLMAIEFSIGRASKKSNALAFNILEPAGTKWHLVKYLGIAGQYLLMMFYTTVTGWMLSYIFLEASGEFNNLTQTSTQQIYDSVTQNPYLCVLMMLLVVFIGIATCSIGVQNGLERITKVLMVALLGIMIFLAVFALFQPGSEQGLSFYLAPNFGELFSGPQRIIQSISEAMSLSFFTLSVGIGSMLIFGSYIGKDRSLFGEAITIGSLDAFVAIVAGLIIFPSCFCYGINPGSGPSLIFITLPTVFSNMQFGQIWGFLFFVFLSFAAISTVNAVFESIIAFWMDLLGWSRHKSCWINFFVIAILSLPCALSFNLLSGVPLPFDSWQSIMDVEDFLVSDIALPIGGVIICWFATSKHGWGWHGAITEINTGKGTKLPTWTYHWIKFGIPVLVIAILIFNWITLF